MTPPRDYPLPASWTTPVPWKLALAAVLFGPLGAFLLSWSIVSLASLHWLRFVFFLSAGTAFVALPALALIKNATRNRTRVGNARALSRDGRTVLQQPRAAQILTVVLLACMVVGGLTFSLGTWTHTLALTQGVRSNTSFAPVGLVVAVLAAVLLVAYAIRGSIGEIALSPSSVTTPNSFFGNTETKWRDIEQVATPNIDARIVALRFNDRTIHSKPALEVSVAEYAVGAAASYRLIEFYHHHPELRVELADHRAAERLHTYRVLESGSASAESPPRGGPESR